MGHHMCRPYECFIHVRRYVKYNDIYLLIPWSEEYHRKHSYTYHYWFIIYIRRLYWKRPILSINSEITLCKLTIVPHEQCCLYKMWFTIPLTGYSIWWLIIDMSKRMLFNLDDVNTQTSTFKLIFLQEKMIDIDFISFINPTQSILRCFCMIWTVLHSIWFGAAIVTHTFWVTNLWILPANEKWCYIVTLFSLAGCIHKWSMPSIPTEAIIWSPVSEMHPSGMWDNESTKNDNLTQKKKAICIWYGIHSSLVIVLQWLPSFLALSNQIICLTRQ